MHELVKQIPERILRSAKGALAQANQHAVFWDPRVEYWDYISVINAAHAGELFMKAVIAKEHPLLIFRDLFNLDDGSEQVDLDILISKGRTHDFEKLPKIMWAVADERIANIDAFERLRKLRNSAQHFCIGESEDPRSASLEFIYSVIDPLIKKHFGLYAIEYHEDFSVSYDYVIAVLIRREIKFSFPPDFSVTEIDLKEELSGVSSAYKIWFEGQLRILEQD